VAAANEASDANEADDLTVIDSTVVEARPGSRQGAQVRVPLASSERSRAGAASWGPPDPQTVMRSRVRASRDTRERLKNRRPPFDDDDVQRLRRDAGGLVQDPREFDDDDGLLARLGLLRGERRVVIIWVSAVVLALTIIFAAVPLLTGNSVLQVLSLRSGDPRLRELLDNARTALLTDTDVGYRDTLKLANDVLDADPSNSEARALYGLAAVFRGIDLRGAAQNMVAEGEVVQSSQMLAAASAELAHARRVLSRRNDESPELAFTAGIYYALDEDQRDHARDAYVRGLRTAHIDGNSPAPTAFAAYLLATLRNLDGDAAGARNALERAIDLEPRWQRPRFELARLEAGRGETGRARVLLAQVIAASENHSKARDLLAVLPATPPEPSPVEKTPQVAPQPEPPRRPSPPAKQAKSDSAKTNAAKEPAAEEGKTPPDQAAKPTDGNTVPQEVQTPPDNAMIRGAPPPFQPPVDQKAPDAN
jgi:tetratricopeptide (TPR) repeat protein